MTRHNAYARILFKRPGARCRATVGNGFEPTSSELRNTTCHIVNPP